MFYAQLFSGQKNKNHFFIFCPLLLISLSGNSQKEDSYPACPLGPEWILNSNFSDEFNGRQFDAAKWWDFNPAWVGRKPAFFSRENVNVKNGKLHLTAKAQNPKKVSIENKVRGYDKYTTATIKSKTRIKYGYFEARCKTMKASVCNAFWLYDPLDAAAKYSAGSFSEEIDIFELFGKPTKKENERTYFATVHRMETPYVESLVKSKQTPLENKSFNMKVPFDFYADFHVYGLLWTPTEMKWYLDGKEVFSRKNDYFNTALHLMLDCEIMEAWAGLPESSDLPATFEIDYVRVWQLAEWSGGLYP
ncbi:MAG: family 16 glycosylhydrolase [Chitinophagaceae bacterium]|jgi:beta-glucanase (GH16 family)|nr:family 16 glycosylhydrolase [Chitinophagaceae bacterium]